MEVLSCESALTLLATRFLLSLKERKSLVKIMYSEVTSYPEKIREVYNKFVDEMRITLAHYFETQQSRGVFKKNMSPEMAARVFLWILFSYFRSEEIMRSAGIKKKAMERDVGAIVDIFMHGASDESAIA
jgi:AefR-like transcriptional repressor, C-terminal domain